MDQLPTSKGTPRAKKQNLDKSHENMAIKQKLKICFLIHKSPWANYPLVKARREPKNKIWTNRMKIWQ